MTPPTNPAAEAWAAFVAKYRSDPVAFVRNVLKIEPDPWQEQFLRALAAGKRRISVRSGHGVGKSSAASWAVLWFILTRLPHKVVITAPTAAQLFDALFAELKTQIGRLPPVLRDALNVTSDRVELKGAPDEGFVSARTSSKERPEALQGIHSANVMLLADEASGIPEEVFEAAAGSMSGHDAVTILLGNPGRRSGLFFRTHHELKDDWWTMRVSSADSPRVSPDFVRQIAATYGEGSNAYRVRVLGEFPVTDDDTLISRELVDAAAVRDVAMAMSAPLVWGLDVARFGGDRTVLAERRLNVVSSLQTWRGLDLMATCGVVKAKWDALAEKDRPVEIMVDSIGLGAGVEDRLRELGLPVRGVNVSESAAMNPQAAKLRDDLWLQVKQWLEKRDCKLPNDADLLDELSAPTYTFTSTGKLKVEGKDELRRRGMRSPDKADALALTFAGTASLVAAGAGSRLSWNKPLKRRIGGIV